MHGNRKLNFARKSNEIKIVLTFQSPFPLEIEDSFRPAAHEFWICCGTIHIQVPQDMEPVPQTARETPKIPNTQVALLEEREGGSGEGQKEECEENYRSGIGG